MLQRVFLDKVRIEHPYGVFRSRIFPLDYEQKFSPFLNLISHLVPMKRRFFIETTFSEIPLQVQANVISYGKYDYLPHDNHCAALFVAPVVPGRASKMADYFQLHSLPPFDSS
jgi:hypothetical protein